MSIQPLNLPIKLPRFCTDNPTAIDEPSESEKDNGFTIDAFVSSQWFNWFQNLNYQWIQTFCSSILGKWEIGVNLSGSYDPKSLCYFPITGQKRWFAYFENSGGADVIWRNQKPSVWNAPSRSGASEGSIQDGLMVYDDTRLIMADYIPSLVQQLIYSIDGTVWTAKNCGVDYEITAIGTKRPLEDDNHIIVGFGNNVLRYASEVTDSFTAPTTEYAGSDPIAIVYMGNDNWCCLYYNGYTYESTDDGDNWIVTTNTPRDIGMTSGLKWMDYNPNSGVLIVVDASGNIARSPNGGTDWESVTQNIGNRIANTYRKVAYVGGSAWVVIGEPFTASPGAFADFPGILISVDDGKTWYLPDYPVRIPIGSIPNDTTMIDIGSNGKQLVVLDDGGNLFQHSLSVIGEETDGS